MNIAWESEVIWFSGDRSYPQSEFLSVSLLIGTKEQVTRGLWVVTQVEISN